MPRAAEVLEKYKDSLDRISDRVRRRLGSKVPDDLTHEQMKDALNKAIQNCPSMWADLRKGSSVTVTTDMFYETDDDCDEQIRKAYNWLKSRGGVEGLGIDRDRLIDEINSIYRPKHK